MKKFVLTISLFIFSFFIAICQPNIQWQKSLGGSMLETAACIQQTTGGGFILAGNSNSIDGDVTGNQGSYDVWVVKLNNSGTIEWQKSLGGSGFEGANSIQQTSDGGFIIAGVSHSNDGDVTGNHGNADYWIVKLTNNGIIEWQKSLGGSGLEYATSIQQTNDGGYIVAGASSSNDGDVSGNQGLDDFWVVKLNGSGTIEWQVSLGGTSNDRANDVLQTIDGGYVVVGSTESSNGDVSNNSGTWDYWVVKLNNAGIIEWQNSLGGSSFEDAKSIQQTIDGGYIVAGHSSSTDGNISNNQGSTDFWIVKLTDVGIVEWQKSLGGTADDIAFSLDQCNDGGFIVVGQSSSNDGDVSINLGTVDFWVVKLTNIGTLEWQKSLGGTNAEWAYAVQQTMDGGYIVAGQSGSNDGDVSGNNGSFDAWVLKLNTCQPIESTLTYNECNPFSVNGIIYNNSGIYTQNLINSNGCDSILTIEAEILNFNAQIFQTDSTLYYNGNPTSIQWINCSTGQAIPGANQVVFVPQQTGNYGAIITIGECVDTSNCNLIPVPPIPKSPPNICENINVFPNPVIDQVAFTLDKESYSINLFSSTGSLVWQKTGTPEKQKIDFRNYAPAMYVLQVDQCRFKIVKQ